MRRKISCSSVLFLLLSIPFQQSVAQTDENKFEAGGQISVFQVGTWSINSVPPFQVTTNRENVVGFGGRIGYNLSEHFAVEAEINFFPNDDELTAGQKTQGLFGVRAGKRFDKVGVFGKARPGFIRSEKGDYFLARGCPAVFPNPLACQDPVARTSFAIDLGGVIEFYPSKRTIVRVDVGDTIVRLPNRTVAAVVVEAPYQAAVPVPAETKHGFQGSIGFGFRF